MFRLLTTCLVAVLLLVVVAPVRAGSIETAEQHSAAARQLFDAGKYPEALDLYVKAYTTYPDAKYVFGIASCHVRLGNLPRALDAYEEYTQYDPTPDILKRVETETRKIKDMLAREYAEVFIFSSPPGAQIIIGDFSKQNVYTTPKRRWLKDGEHSIFFKKDKHLPREMKLNVKKGEHLYIYAGLKPE